MRHRQIMSLISLFLWTLALMFAVPSFGEEESSPLKVLHLGPIPLPAVDAVTGDFAPRETMVPEIDPLRSRPREGEPVELQPDRQLKWRKTPFPPKVLKSVGVHWISVKLICTDYGNYHWRTDFPGHLTLYLDGEERPLEKAVVLRRGSYRLMLRLVVAPDDSVGTAAPLTVTGKGAASLKWSLAPDFAPARYDQTRQLARYTALAAASGGRFIARSLSRRDPTGNGRTNSLQILSRQRTVVASLLDGDRGRPVLFTPDGRELLVRRPAGEGEDLLYWAVNGGASRTLLHAEPGISLIRQSRDGGSLLIVSKGGMKEEKASPEDSIHQSELRTSIPDYTPGDVLHLIDTASGVRRQLTRAGDCVIEDAVFFPGDQAILYARTRPLEERPWFVTELRRLDLDTGEESEVSSFTAGWEVRPDDLAISPNGQRVVFTGPPEEIGPGHGEHNVYNRSLHVLDLTTKQSERVRLEQGWSFNAAHDLGVMSWMSDSALLTVADAGSGHRLVRILVGEGAWRARTFPFEGEVIESAALSPDQQVLAYVVSGRDLPPQLRMMDFHQEREFEMESPNAALPWVLAPAEDASFKGPHGEMIDAWWYAPSAFDGEGPGPLIVYYYGGASPTSRRFNSTHQWLCANGYRVLVINPRGAYGYGDAFADCHAGDWGPKASADILRGVEVFLKSHREIDAKRVGIYGGSYGGFMTAYLLTQTSRFAAAVDYYGISDITSYWGQGSWGPTYGDMSVAGKHPWDARKLFAGRSPVFNADKITTPLLLMHGLADNNVPPGESRQLFTALKMQNRPVEMVLFPGENHGIGGTFSVFVRQRGMMLDWFDRWLRDQPEAWNDRWPKNKAGTDGNDSSS